MPANSRWDLIRRLRVKKEWNYLGVLVKYIIRNTIRRWLLWNGIYGDDNDD